MAKELIFLWTILLGPVTLLATVFQVKEESPVSVMTFNIRYDNPGDKPNDWPSRRDWAGDLVAFYHPDFVGVQEALHNQLVDMQGRLPDYTFFGAGRDDGKLSGEFCAIFYKKEKFDLVRSATFWLSETPEKPGIMGWDAVCNRVVTWGEFKNKSTGKSFFVFNTHFDHMGKIAREESSKLVLTKVSEIAGNKDAIIIGDFNSDPESSVYQRLTNGFSGTKGLKDVYKLAEKPYGPFWTFHSFGKTPLASRNRIDYIFVNRNVKVKRYVAISEQRGDIFPSDHLPVMAEIVFESLLNINETK
jgi:endonuclease/exonuclease/phosphatase family metal-dependent hydrolase